MEAGREGIHCTISTVITLKPKDAFRSNYHASDILHFKGTFIHLQAEKTIEVFGCGTGNLSNISRTLVLHREKSLLS